VGPCTWFYEVSHPLVFEWDWSVRAHFEVGGRSSHEDWHVEFEYRKVQRLVSVPGAWVDI
jgi:hypothetical protein